MYNWIIEPVMPSARGNPRQMTDHYDNQIHAYTAERLSGPGDSDDLPRILFASGRKRASAMRSLRASMRRYDHRPTVVSSR